MPVVIVSAKAADRAEQAREDICREPRALDIDPAAERRIAIAADRVDLQPELRAPKRDPDDGDRLRRAG